MPDQAWAAWAVASAASAWAPDPDEINEEKESAEAKQSTKLLLKAVPNGLGSRPAVHVRHPFPPIGTQLELQVRAASEICR